MDIAQIKRVASVSIDILFLIRTGFVRVYFMTTFANYSLNFVQFT